MGHRQGPAPGHGAVSVIDDVRSWETSWRLLKSAEDTLARVVGSLIDVVSNYLALGIGAYSGALPYAGAATTNMDDSLRAIFFQRSNISDHMSALKAQSDDPDKPFQDNPPSMMLSCHVVGNVLRANGARGYPDPEPLTQEKSTARVRLAIETHASQLLRLNGPQSSVEL